jgi:two-component sensor histidine kinase
MALVHENLYHAGNFARISTPGHIEKLCSHLFHAYDRRDHRAELTVDVDDVDLDLDRATSVSLIVNELVSNALKHAFPDNRAGRISVEMKRLYETQCTLAVGDDGIGLPDDFILVAENPSGCN